MANQSARRVRIAALALTCFGVALAAAPSPALAQYLHAQSLPPGEVLSRYVRQLASNPNDFGALVGAGQAALALGDTKAAAGFFGRAEEVNPRSPLPQAGMGAALAHSGDPNGALRYFAAAIQFGATPVTIGVERGLAFDLLGSHAAAQADFRAALAGADANEARRRLALSLAISGNRDEALNTLIPLTARGDSAAGRTRAFVLALTGDVNGARAMLEARMPGSSANWAYFLHRLPSLPSTQKAAAVHLGVFPGQPGQVGVPQPQGDRLASIDQILSGTAPSQPIAAPPSGNPIPQAQPHFPPSQGQAIAAHNLPPVAAQPPVTGGSTTAHGDAEVYSAQRLWLQLASGPNAEGMPDQFRRIRARSRNLFDGITGYVAESHDRARLLVGPFRNASEARIFADDLASLRVSAFTWTNPPGQVIRRLPSE